MTITTEAEYEAALARVWALMDTELDTPEEVELQALVLDVEAYEQVHYPIDAPSTPIIMDVFGRIATVVSHIWRLVRDKEAWVKINEVRRYRIYETPETCRYQLEDALDIDVIWDEGYWLAQPSNPAGSNMYGTGGSVKKAIRDLIETMDADYRRDIAHIERSPGDKASANYEGYTKLFYKK